MNIINKLKQHPNSWTKFLAGNGSRKPKLFAWTYFKHINSKGIIFSLDAGISFSITLVTVLLFATFLAQTASSTQNEIKNFELEEKAILIADSLVKNYDENNSLLGTCILDIEKKRIRTNEISFSNLINLKPISFGEIYVESITVKTNSFQKTFQIEEKVSNDCISVRRFALIEGEKGIIEVKTCTLK
ncbi:MAG: hypothetical protein WCW44_03210 [archaeon]